jgi:hypothetical protein
MLEKKILGYFVHENSKIVRWHIVYEVLPGEIRLEDAILGNAVFDSRSAPECTIAQSHTEFVEFRAVGIASVVIDGNRVVCAQRVVHKEGVIDWLFLDHIEGIAVLRQKLSWYREYQ